ncbi:DHS-like NAD/FAD-binding domain-containing protein [Ceratobasidium sp. AG-I]|nr:DHS-like NAD/FAD-binding domain-containing protein [Ceratobasidium sp. AG-I]
MKQKAQPQRKRAVNSKGNALNIPVIRAADETYRQSYRDLLDIIASAAAVTVVCGAGISTTAGIPDFRSKEGLYHQSFGDHTLLSGSELFSLLSLVDPEKRRIFNRTLTRMRIKAREAPTTQCHKYIEKLFDTGRLLRCYTQNIDGLQTRDRPDMIEGVIEMHGSNVDLVCSKCRRRPPGPTKDLDDQFLDFGLVVCPSCEDDFIKAQNGNKRRRNRGELLPNIVFNEDSIEHLHNEQPLSDILKADGQAGLLLVIGTTLRIDGMVKLVKSLARSVKKSGGAVLYVNRDPLPASAWRTYFDLHIETDIDEWADDLLSRIPEIIPQDGDSGLSRKILDVAGTVHQSVNSYVPAIPLSRAKSSGPRQTVPTCGTSGSELEDPGTSMLVNKWPLSKRSSRQALTPEKDESIRLLLVVLHDGWTILEARALAAQMADSCLRLGWQCRHHILEFRDRNKLKLDPSEW